MTSLSGYLSQVQIIEGKTPGNAIGLHVRDDAGTRADDPLLVEALQKAVVEHLGSERIAGFTAQDRTRANREVSSSIQRELCAPAFSYLSETEKRRLAIRVTADMIGLGPIEALLKDPDVTEIMVNGPDAVFFERAGRIEQSDIVFPDEEHLRRVIDRILAPLGRRVDEQSPMVSARLPEGHRVNVVIPPLSLIGPILTIRKFRERIFTLAELVECGSISAPLSKLLTWAVRARKNIAVSGGTGGGKTTLLNALSCEIDPAERIITIEDSAELRFDSHPHVVRLESRPPNIEGRGEVTIRDLMTNALRMRPDRIVIGECRGAEALDMLQAMNTGHEGSLTTLHANSPYEVVGRLTTMARYAMDLPVSVIEEQISSALDLVVQQDRFADGGRRVTAVVAVGRRTASGVELSPIATWDAREGGYHSSTEPAWVEDLSLSGIATEEEVASWRSEMGFLS